MCHAIDTPANCEIRAVIRFLHDEIISAAEIHCELCAAIYGQNVMGEGTVIQWCRMFKDWRRFTISELSCEFQQVSRTVLNKIVKVQLRYHKFCTRWVPKMPTGAHKTQRISSALTLTAIPQRWP
jgi:hypothetical protein